MKESHKLIQTLLEKKQQIDACDKSIEKDEAQKSLIIKFLEEKRKLDEMTYLKPILDQLSQTEKQLTDSKMEYCQMICQELEAFAQKQGSMDAETLLKEYEYIKTTCADFDQIDKYAHCLFEYFVEAKDISSAVKFLRCRAGSKQDKSSEEKLQRYLAHMEESPTPTCSVEEESILGYSEYAPDIATLVELCGKQDFAAMPKCQKGVYFSETTKQVIAMASVGEFGKLAQHIFYDFPYGFGVSDSDRRTLLKCHDKAFETAQLEAQSSEEKVL